MKLKLSIIFISVLIILLMLGVGIVQGDDVVYPAPIGIEEPGYPIDDGVPDGFYITSTPQPKLVIYVDDGGYPVSEVADYSTGYPMIEPQYVNGRNLWEEIVFQFAKLLELMK